MQQITDNEQVSRIREVLKQYQKMGLVVIPCEEKKPRIPDWPKRNMPPTDLEIEDWLQKWPNMNIGLVLGTGSRIIGIDIDGSLALEMLQELCNGDIPETWMFKTPGNVVGRRLLFKRGHGDRFVVPRSKLCYAP